MIHRGPGHLTLERIMTRAKASISIVSRRSVWRSLILLIAPLVVAGATEPSRHITDLQAGGFFGAITIASPIVTVAAAQRFFQLTPDSQMELCQIVLNYHHRVDATLTAVKIVGDGLRVLVTCST